MAGAYPDYPSYRIAWDRDGTKLYSIEGGVSTSITDTEAETLLAEEPTTAEILNDEDPTTTVRRDRTLAWVFPFGMNIEAVMIYTDGGGTTTIETSNDSTNALRF